ncbi:MAG: rhodanese-like domain-containing protein [Acidimicrobiia bacterium]
MPIPIERDEVQRLVAEEGAQIVDVLPGWEYDEEHLPGAISIPLKRLDRETAARLGRDKPVVVY